MNYLLTLIESNPALVVGFNLILLLASGIFAHPLCKFSLVKVVRKVLFSSHKQNVPLEKDRRIAEKLSNFTPVTIVHCALQFMSAMPASLVTAINTVCGILFFIFISVFSNKVLDIVSSSHLRKIKRKNHSIKGYIQIGKILVHILAAIVILAVMSNKSPIIIISSLGVVMAVLMIMLQRTLLLLVANVQSSPNDVPQLGDWIEMPDKSLSGEITDIALRTITIRNWDNTISCIPTKNFLTETYTNWQAMSLSGARWIMRSIAIDQRSVRSPDQKMFSLMLTIRGVSESLGALLDGRDPDGVADRWLVDNGPTNLTLFRHYLMHYLAERSDITKEMYIVARTLKPSPSGTSLEIYCFTSSTLWEDYENIQSAIFEYITAVAGQFSPRLYQYSTGHDLRRLSQERVARTGLPSPAGG